MPRGRHVRMLAIATLLVAGSLPMGLVLTGLPREATVLWSVGERGARNRSWRVAYRYVVDGQAYRGMSKASRALPAGMPLEIRTLPGLPRIASALTDGALLLWAAVAWIPCGFTWVGASALSQRRARSKQSHRLRGV